MSDRPALRIVFAGTPAFAVPALTGLVDGGYRPLAVLTRPDRPAGRGRIAAASAVKQAATAAGLEVFQPESLRDEASRKLLAALQPDVIVVVAYGLIFPPAVLTIPRHGCWNIHASLLPRWRGAAPIQRAIEAGDAESGVCIMRMDEGLDTGPVLARRRLTLQADETGASLHDRLARLGAEALLSCLDDLSRGRPPEAIPQASHGVSHARKLEKREARLDWRQDAAALERKVRAFNPWPVAWCDIGGEPTRVWAARAVTAGAGAAPGTVIATGSAGLDIATGNGVLRLLELQRPGGRRISIADYLNARRLPAVLPAAE